MSTSIAVNSKAKPVSLEKMLTYRRAHNSPGEKRFVKDYIMPLKPHIVATPDREPMAFFVYVGNSNIMFTAHVDTVHMKTDEMWQKVYIKDGRYCKKDNQPLGSDDASGVWLLINMIHAGVPGIYAFFRGEERGGIGSSYCAEHCKELFEGVKCAIAFDRRGTKSIITHQGGGRGCSDKFANSLASILKMGHKCDTSGVYTDTAEFFDLIPNCTNVSVGYDREHSKEETQEIVYIEKLRDALIAADWTQLDHTPPEPDGEEIIQRNFMSLGTKITSGARVVGNSLFDPSPDEITPLVIADFIFDTADKLDRSLRDKAFELSQLIYEKYEGP